MKKRNCTAFTEPPKRCGRYDECTRVLVETGGGDMRGRARPLKHWVCPECRQRMKLPDYDVRVTRAGTVAL